MKLHSGGFKPHKCDSCDKSYAYKSELKIHQKTQQNPPKLKVFWGQNSRNLPKLNFSEIPLPYVAGKTAKKKPGLNPGLMSPLPSMLSTYA